MVRCYFDDSGTHDASRVVVVGGIVACDEQYNLLKETWVSILRRKGLPFFHMTRFKAGKESPYSEMSELEKEVLLDQLMLVMGVRIAKSFSCVIPAAPYEAVITEQEKRRYGAAYSFATQMCWTIIRLWADKHDHSDPIPFVVERGTKGEEHLSAVFNKVAADPTMKELYRLHSLVCGAKKDFPGLQAADIIANSAHDLGTHYMTGGRTPSKWAGIVSDRIVRTGLHSQLILDEKLLRSETDRMNEYHREAIASQAEKLTSNEA